MNIQSQPDDHTIAKDEWIEEKSCLESACSVEDLRCDRTLYIKH